MVRPPPSIHNNRIYDFALSTSSHISNTCIGIRVDGGARAVIRNNQISNNKDSQDNGGETWVGIGVWVKSTNGTRIEGNIFSSNFVNYGASNDRGDCNVYAPAGKRRCGTTH